MSSFSFRQNDKKNKTGPFDPAFTGETKSSYQQNVATPTAEDKWYKGDQPTTRETLGQILRITQQDNDRGVKMQNDFSTLQMDRTSMFYAPYVKPTNQAVGNLTALGYDTSKIDDDWFTANKGLEQYY